MASRDTTPRIINPSCLPDPTPHGYSTAVVTPAAGRLAFISGLGGHDTDGGFPPDFGQQVNLAYAHLLAVLESLGAAPRQVVKLTLFVVGHDMPKLGPLTQAVRCAFGDAPPAQTLVPVPRLALDAMLFEVEAVVWLD
ncbi:RidA family protein [Sediminicoccus rosea]|jgi:enamine deaminase RidA (YjgF/YER057c/UK114 family)|uniref:RidA family protein n=1 Tax=Sediminicoccus rosea TaxID=1225128 RepID=A0ABZ0PM24_9PROT|nr:RidA family protein [Sediminicoccus rosea]WPB86769.1 RidA family protein [Sediminicoccus rosea]